MSVFRYPTYKIRIAPDSQKTQGLQAGDIIRRQYAERERTVYSLMCVTETGTELVGDKDAPYFIGALLDGDEPQGGELLDFVRITNLFDTARSGALYLTASDSDSPYMDVIDGMATERSLCYPVMDGGMAGVPDKSRYAVYGSMLQTEYLDADSEATRIVRIIRNAEPAGNASFGLMLTLEEPVGYPERLLVSFKVRSSKTSGSVPIRFGYTNREKTDAEDEISIGREWKYKLWVITVDYPAQYSRSLFLDLTSSLASEGDWCEVADLNIVRLASVSAFSEASKARVGKVSGIIDPVFGMLDGYGAYFQNLYATRNVNIAGTLTAGDENGFSSTFYVGKIHKNVIPDSLSCRFSHSEELDETSPAGLGRCVRIAGDSLLGAQSAAWREAHTGVCYCFSVWIKAEDTAAIRFYQDEHLVGDRTVAAGKGWVRYNVPFLIRGSDSPVMCLGIAASVPLSLSAPQLEAGRNVTPYQATDEALSYTDDYGAWFNKGGIGGTIQNPLLRLNEDGSIVSRDGSFVIHPDGTGHFASGRFKWGKDTIELRDVTIRWEDLDEEAQELLKPRSVSLTGGTAFHFKDELSGACEPENIPLVATEYNFEPESRQWEYLAVDGIWKDAGCNAAVFEMTPPFHGWEGRDVLTLRYTATYRNEKISATHTFFKLYDGSPSYTVYVESENGTTFRNGIVSTVLRARVYRGGEEITSLIPDGNFRWIRTSRDTESDRIWNAAPRYGREIEITGGDVWRKAVFDCEVEITNNRESIMAVKVARGQVTIIDQNDAVSLQAFIGSSQPLTQVYNRDNNAYAPSWAASPYLVLTPSLFVSGQAATDQITSVGNAATLTAGVKSGSAKWYKNGTAIVSGQDSCTIGAASAKYALTVKANHMTVSAPQVRYTFEAVYIDANGLEIPFRAEIQFTQHLNAGAMIAAVAYAPDGIVFKNDEVATLRAHCDLWRGASIDTTNVTYAWGIKDSAVFAGTTLTAAAAAGATTITVASVMNMEAGGRITIGSAQYTISAVNASTKVVTLTSALSAAAASGAAVSCPYYNSMLGAGWACLTSTNPRGVTAGWTTNEITITADAVLNFETFKCAIKDTDTSAGNASANKVVCDIISFTDMSDPITVDLVSQKGFTIKNNGNDVDAKAVLYRGGEEIDTGGTAYTYTWKLWNSAGTSVVKTYTGKSITVSKADVTGKGVLMCEVSK